MCEIMCEILCLNPSEPHIHMVLVWGIVKKIGAHVWHKEDPRSTPAAAWLP